MHARIRTVTMAEPIGTTQDDGESPPGAEFLLEKDKETSEKEVSDR